MTTFRTLNWSEFFSYGPNNTLILDEDPLVQLVGMNGHGKTSIPLIIEEILYNGNSKGTKRGSVANRKGSGKYSGTIEFDNGGHSYTVTVERGSTIKVRLLKGGVDISGHTSTKTFDTIKQILGMDRKAFSALFYQNSKSSLQFLTATDTQRKKFLIELRGLERYVEIFEKLKEVRKEATGALNTITGEIESVQGWVDKHKTVDLTRAQLCTVPNDDTTELISQKAVLEAQLSTIVETNNKIRSNRARKSRLESFGIEDLSPLGYSVQSTEPLDASISNKRAEIKVLQQQVAKLTSLPGKCPTCTQPVPQEWVASTIDSLEDNIAKLLKALADESNLLSDIKESNQALIKRNSMIREFETLMASVDSSLPDELLINADIERQITQLNNSINAIRKTVKDARDANTKAVAHNAKVEQIEENLAEYRKRIAELNTKREAAASDVGDLEVLTKVFSTTGLVAFIIERSVQALQEHTNEYLQELSQGRFQLDYSISGDKLPVVVYDNGSEVDITDLSSGELARVTTATLLAIRKLMVTESSAPMNLLFLDETVDSLDEVGREALVEILLREHDLNVFMISHGFTHPLVKKISVIKENEISRLEEL